MAEKFAKSGKSEAEVVEVLKYVTHDGISSMEVTEVYKHWASAFDKVSTHKSYDPFFVEFGFKLNHTEKGKWPSKGLS